MCTSGIRSSVSSRTLRITKSRSDVFRAKRFGVRWRQPPLWNRRFEAQAGAGKLKRALLVIQACLRVVVLSLKREFQSGGWRHRTPKRFARNDSRSLFLPTALRGVQKSRQSNIGSCFCARAQMRSYSSRTQGWISLARSRGSFVPSRHTQSLRNRVWPPQCRRVLCTFPAPLQKSSESWRFFSNSCIYFPPYTTSPPTTV
jgi:hypothetical protein